jgi:hypothetical protein
MGTILRRAICIPEANMWERRCLLFSDDEAAVPPSADVDASYTVVLTVASCAMRYDDGDRFLFVDI